MPRRLLALPSVGIAVALVALSSASPATAASPDGSSPYGFTRDILPPGSSGDVDAAQFAQVIGPNAAATALSPTSLLTQLQGGDTAGLEGDALTASPTTPTNFADQLEQYDDLTKHPATDSTITADYKDSPLGVKAADVVRTETPRAGTTIRWDKSGVPHIHGDTYSDVSYGAGVAVMEDRMFLTDALRNTGKGSMSSFLGPSDADIAQDAAQLRVAAYTDAERTKQVEDFAAHNGPEGQKLLAGTQAYVDGINAEIDTLCPASTPVTLPGNLGVGFGVNCPVEYAGLQRAPQHYTLGDVVAIASLVGGIFGTGGAGQYTNAIWYEQLVAQYGKAKALSIYDDLRERDDPEAPTTSPVAAPYGNQGGLDPDLPGVALPDLKPTASELGTGALVASDGTLSAPPAGAAGNQGNASTSDPKPAPTDRSAPTSPAVAAVKARSEGQQVQGWLARAMSGEMVGMSNELIVDAKHSAGGHPVAVFGPQTGYYTPQLLMEEDLDGPGIQARGVSFAGTNFVVELGHGVDYAWSATSPYTDITDTVVQKLCSTDGSAVTVESTSYVDTAGKCVPMENYVNSQTALPTLVGAGQPQTVKMLVLITDQGIVQRRTTVKGVPVAITTDRSTYTHDVDSILGFALLDDPGFVHSPQTFVKAVSKIQFTFNWFYVDSKHIAYFSSARLPKRSPQTEIDLPRWGSAAYAPTGIEPDSVHPQVIDPAQGYLVNWNNKLAPHFDAGSENWSDGPVYRSLTLQDRVRSLVSKGGVTRAGLVGAMEGAATVDVRGAYVLPDVLRVVGTPADPQAAAAVALLKTWVASGAHRLDAGRTGTYADQAAIDLFDTWWDPVEAGASCGSTCGFALPYDALRGDPATSTEALGAYVATLPEPLDDAPSEHIGSAYNGISWYSYLDKDLRTVAGQPVVGKYSHGYCGNGVLATCKTELTASLVKAVQAALTTQSVTAPSALTFDETHDDIISAAGGVVMSRHIRWQNRPTFQQVVQFTSHRPEAVTVTPGVPTRTPTATPTAPRLPTTGLPVGLAAAGVVALLGGLVLRRRRAH